MCFRMLAVILIADLFFQLVEHLSKKPGAILMQVRVPSVTRDFSPRVNFQCRLSYSVRTVPVAIACISTCVHAKNPKHL